MSFKPINYDKNFISHFRKRIKNKKKLVNLYKLALELFVKSPEHPDLKNHSLEKRKRNLEGCRAFSINHDIRVIYREEKDFYYFLDIGTHKEVYGEGKD